MMKAKLLKDFPGYELKEGQIIELQIAKGVGAMLGKYTTDDGNNPNRKPIIKEEDVEILPLTI